MLAKPSSAYAKAKLLHGTECPVFGKALFCVQNLLAKLMVFAILLYDDDEDQVLTLIFFVHKKYYTINTTFT